MLPNRIVLTALLGAALATAGCSGNESSPFEPTIQPAFSKGSENGGGDHGWGEHRPGSCKPLQADTESEDIGPRGGVLEVGPHRLIVPPGALRRKTRITGRISSDSANSVQFSPEGLHFLVPARLQLSYKNCRQQALKNASVVYTSNDLVQLLELIPSEDTKLQSTVVGIINHFSRYAVAY